jgi:hypothetical protein
LMIMDRVNRSCMVAVMASSTPFFESSTCVPHQSLEG